MHAFSAFKALTCLPMALSQHVAVIDPLVPVVEHFLRVQAGENIGDQDSLRAVIFLNAIMAGGTGDKVQSAENGLHLLYCLMFRFGKRLKILHI